MWGEFPSDYQREVVSECMARRAQLRSYRETQALAKGRKSHTYQEWRSTYPGGYDILEGAIVEVGRCDRGRPNYVKRCAGDQPPL